MAPSTPKIPATSTPTSPRSPTAARSPTSPSPRSAQTTLSAKPLRPAHLPNPLHLPEILGIIFTHLPTPDLAQCLAVSRLWFDCAVQGLYRHVRMVDLLRVVEVGRKEGGPRLGQFVVTLQDVERLQKYAPHITTLSLSSQEQKHRDVRHAWKASGRSYALVPLDPLDQFSQLLTQWHHLAFSHPQFLPSHRQLREGEVPTLQDLFPRLRGLKGAFGIDDELGALVSLDFTLPLDSPSAFINGLTYPFLAAYTYNMERELRGFELLLRSSEAYACLTEIWPYFFFHLRQSATMKSLEICAMWEQKTEDAVDWRARWQEDASVPYPEKKCSLKRLILRAPKPHQLLEKLLSEDMLGPTMPELESVYFGVEDEVQVEEWEMSEEEDEEGLLHPFAIDEDMSDDDQDGHGHGHGSEDEDGHGHAHGEEEETSTDETESEDTDVTTDSSVSGSGGSGSEGASVSEASGSGDDAHFHDASMSGSPVSQHGHQDHGGEGEGEEGSEWQTEDEIQVDESEAAAAEALFAEGELLPGRLPAYFEEAYKPPPGVRYSIQLRDGRVLGRLCAILARGCPALKRVGWDGRGLARVGAGWGWEGMSVRGRAEVLEKEIRRVLDGR